MKQKMVSKLWSRMVTEAVQVKRTKRNKSVEGNVGERKCFDKHSGGLRGGLDPPAFQHTERERMSKSQSEESAVKSDDLGKASNGACESRMEELHASKPESIGANVKGATKDSEHVESHKYHMNAKTHDESESLSNIDDQEIDGYIINDEVATKYRRILWEHVNREYLEEQANANFQNCSAAAAVAKSRKRRAQKVKSLGPAESAGEAASEMMKKKRLSSKVNFDVLGKLFEPVAPELPSDDNHDNFESKLEDKIKDDELGSVNEIQDGEYENSLHQENAEDTYDYDYDYDCYSYGY